MRFVKSILSVALIASAFTLNVSPSGMAAGGGVTDAKIVGVPTVGSTLTVSVGAFDIGTKTEFQWLRDTQAIKNATKASYKLTSGDFAKSISVRVIGTRAGTLVAGFAITDSLVAAGSVTPKFAPIHASQISVYNSLFVRHFNGSVECFGDECFGVRSSTAYPGNAPGWSSWANSIDASRGTACSVTQSHALQCWGNPGTVNSPPSAGINVTSQPSTYKVVTGQIGRCGLRLDSSAACWWSLAPANLPSQNGYIDVYFSTPRSYNSPTQCYEWVNKKVYCPDEVTGIFDPISVSSSFDLATRCALESAGTIKCWGWNTQPVAIEGINTAISMDVGDDHACAVLSDHTIRCWGANDLGQLGDGTQVTRNTPVKVVGINTAISISAGSKTTCALLADYSVSCWGDNSHAIVANNSSTSLLTPTNVPGSLEVVSKGSWGVPIIKGKFIGQLVSVNGVQKTQWTAKVASSITTSWQQLPKSWKVKYTLVTSKGVKLLALSSSKFQIPASAKGKIVAVSGQVLFPGMKPFSEKSEYILVK